MTEYIEYYSDIGINEEMSRGFRDIGFRFSSATWVRDNLLRFMFIRDSNTPNVRKVEEHTLRETP